MFPQPLWLRRPSRLLKSIRLFTHSLSAIRLLSVLTVYFPLLLWHFIVSERGRIVFARCCLQRSSRAIGMGRDRLLVVVDFGWDRCLDLSWVHASSIVWSVRGFGSNGWCDGREASKSWEGLACDRHGCEWVRGELRGCWLQIDLKVWIRVDEL